MRWICSTLVVVSLAVLGSCKSHSKSSVSSSNDTSSVQLTSLNWEDHYKYIGKCAVIVKWGADEAGGVGRISSLSAWNINFLAGEETDAGKAEFIDNKNIKSISILRDPAKDGVCGKSPVQVTYRMPERKQYKCQCYYSFSEPSGGVKETILFDDSACTKSTSETVTLYNNACDAAGIGYERLPHETKTRTFYYQKQKFQGEAFNSPVIGYECLPKKLESKFARPCTKVE